MMMLKDVAQQARYAAMLPGQISQHWAQQNADLLEFDAAVAWAANARSLREAKRAGGSLGFSGGRIEALARQAESHVREIALRSEIVLQRRADAADADRAMLRAMMAEAS